MRSSGCCFDVGPLSSLPELLCTSFFARLLDTLHVVLLAHFIYHYTITNFGDYAALVPNMWYVVCTLITRLSR